MPEQARAGGHGWGPGVPGRCWDPAVVAALPSPGSVPPRRAARRRLSVSPVLPAAPVTARFILQALIK